MQVLRQSAKKLYGIPRAHPARHGVARPRVAVRRRFIRASDPALRRRGSGPGIRV